MTGKARIDVVVPTKNSSRTLSACLKGLFESDVPVGRVIVVDNSTDDTPEIARKFGCEVVVSDANCAQATRQGAKKAETRCILILDSDVLINRNFYGRLQPYLGKYFVAKGVQRHYLRNWKRLSEMLFDITRYHITALEAAFVERDLFLKLTKNWEYGQLDAGQDADLYRKCSQLGIPVVQLPDLVSVHLTGDFTRLWKQTRWYGKSARKSGIQPFKAYLTLFLTSPFRGVNLAWRYRDLRIIPFWIILRLGYIVGYWLD